MTRGQLISFEGPDGAGKTSVLQALLPELERLWPAGVVTTREPGGVAIAEQIREVILDIKNTEMDAKTELLLYIAARRQHLVEKVLPALEAGKLVLMDRFIDSSVAYQGYGRGQDLGAINWLNAYATDGLEPDLTLCFDVPSELGLARINQNADREVNRLDLEAVDMHQRVRAGYGAIAEQHDRVVVIDASQELDQVIAATYAVIAERLS